MSWTTPKTWNVGDPMTASDLNTYVRDNTNALAQGMGLYGSNFGGVPAGTPVLTQAGNQSFAFSGGSATLTYPKPFPTTAVGILGSSTNADTTIGFINASATGATIYSYVGSAGDTATRYVTWLAFGY